MRLLTLPLLLLLISCGGSSSDDDNGRSSTKTATRYGWEGELHGDVESIVEQGYDVKIKLHGDELTPSYCSTIKFNDLGNVDEIYQDNDCDNIIDSTTKYSYDDNNHITGYVSDYYDSETKYSTKFETDTRGNITLEAHYDSHSISQFGTRYRYNHDDKPIEISRYNKSGELSSKEIIKYHNNGELKECLSYDAEGELTYEFTTTLNSRGKIEVIRYLSYDDDGDIENIMEQEYYYNELNQLTEIVNINKLKRERTKRRMEYDAQGNVIRIERYESEACILKEVTERNITYRK